MKISRGRKFSLFHFFLLLFSIKGINQSSVRSSPIIFACAITIEQLEKVLFTELFDMPSKSKERWSLCLILMTIEQISGVYYIYLIFLTPC